MNLGKYREILRLRSLGAPFFIEMLAELIAFETGGASALTKEELLADIGPPALKAFDAEVIGVSDRPLMK